MDATKCYRPDALQSMPNAEYSPIQMHRCFASVAAIQSIAAVLSCIALLLSMRCHAMRQRSIPRLVLQDKGRKKKKKTFFFLFFFFLFALASCIDCILSRKSIPRRPQECRPYLAGRNECKPNKHRLLSRRAPYPATHRDASSQLHLKVYFPLRDRELRQFEKHFFFSFLIDASFFLIFEGIEPTFQTYQVCTLTVKLKNQEA